MYEVSGKKEKYQRCDGEFEVFIQKMGALVVL